MLASVYFWSAPSAIDVASKAILLFALFAFWDLESIGTVNLVLLLFSYFTLSHLGLLDGLKLHLASFNVRGEELKFANYSNSVCSTHVMLAIAVICILLLIYSSGLFALDDGLWLAIFCFATSNVAYSIYINQVIYFRFKFQIRDIAKLRLLPAFVRIFFQLPISLVFGLIGFLICEMLVFTLPAILLLKKRADLVFNLPSMDILKNVWALGVPIFLIGITDLVLATQDRALVASSSSIEKFANYSMAAYLCSVFMFLPSQFLSLTMQQLREWFSIDLKPQDGFEIVSFLGFCVLAAWFLIALAVNVFVGLFAGENEKLLRVSEIFPFLWALLAIRMSISIVNSILMNLEMGKIVLVFNCIGIAITFALFSQDIWLAPEDPIAKILFATTFGLFAQLVVTLLGFVILLRTPLILVFKYALFVLFCFFGCASLSILASPDNLGFIFKTKLFWTVLPSYFWTYKVVFCSIAMLCFLLSSFRNGLLQNIRCLLLREYADD